MVPFVASPRDRGSYRFVVQNDSCRVKTKLQKCYCLGFCSFWWTVQKNVINTQGRELDSETAFTIQQRLIEREKVRVGYRATHVSDTFNL